MQKLLILARHYPPAVSGGAARPYLLAAALRDIGIDVRVCAPSRPPNEPGWTVPHPNRDPAEPSSASTTQRLDPRAIGRDLLLWPDPDIRWARRAARVAAASDWRPDWVLSTSPPESIHVAGQWLAKKLNAKWAADFRDLWLDAPHRRERLRWHRRIGERMMARRLLLHADLVLAVDPVVANELREFGANTPHVLAHFASDAHPHAFAFEPDKLHIVHAGSIALSDPLARIEDLLRPFETAAKARGDLRLHLVGRLTSAEIETVKSSPAAAAIEIHGPKDYEIARSMMAGADALILVGSLKTHVPPSKIREYLTFDLPIVACGEGTWRADPRLPPQNADTILSSLNRGQGRNVDARPFLARDAAQQFLELAEVARR